jgi:hypothetical protein
MDETNCSIPGCSASFKNHKWGTMAASKAGWLMQKDGTVWCPDHLPDWVAAWRASQKVPAQSDKGGNDT